MATTFEETVEGIDPEGRIAAIGNRFTELERRIEDVEAGQMVSDDALILVEIMSSLDDLREQNAALLSALRAFLAAP